MDLKTYMKIFEILSSNPNITILELAQQIDKSESAVCLLCNRTVTEQAIFVIKPKQKPYFLEEFV